MECKHDVRVDCILGCDSVWSCKHIPTFRTNVMSSFSRLKCVERRIGGVKESGCKGGVRFLRNVGTHAQNYRVFQSGIEAETAYGCRHVFPRFLLQISTGAPVILIQNFRSFLPSLQGNSTINIFVRLRPLLLKSPPQFINHRRCIP
jgi:hypothetical protein